MFATSSESKCNITLKIMGNKRDSRTEWEDARNKIARHHVIQPFLAGAVGTNIPWSIVPERRRDQERGINLAFTILVDMAGSQTVRSFIRKIENNNLTNPPVLAEDVDKVRRIFAYYDEITIDNNTKDTELIRQLAGIKFDSTGKGNLSIDVNDYFERISKNQEDTQLQHRMSDFQSEKTCSAHLSKYISSLRSPLSTINLMTMTFDELRTALNDICQNIEVHEGHQHDDDISSNSTSSSSRAEELIAVTPSKLKDAIMNVVRKVRDGDRSNNRRDSIYRPRDSSENRGRSKSKSPIRFQQRGRSRSQSNDRSSSGGKKWRKLKFAGSTNSTQAVEGHFENDEDDDDNGLIDGLIDGHFDEWTTK